MASLLKRHPEVLDVFGKDYPQEVKLVRKHVIEAMLKRPHEMKLVSDLRPSELAHTIFQETMHLARHHWEVMAAVKDVARDPRKEAFETLHRLLKAEATIYQVVLSLCRDLLQKEVKWERSD